MQYYYLLKNDPAQLKGSQGINAWANFEWPDEYEQALLKENVEYTKLKEKKAQLLSLNQGHKDWPTRREVFKSLANTKQHTDLIETLHGKMSKIEKRLKKN